MAVDNLKNINGTWYVRVAIPAELRSAFGGKTEFLKSLKTGRKSEAMVLRTKDLHEFKNRIASERRRLVVEQEMSSLSLLPSAARFDELFESLQEIKAGLAEKKQERKKDFEESDYEDIHALKKIEGHRNFLNHLLLEKQALGEELNPAQAELLNELNEFEKLPNKSFKKAEDLLEKLEKSNVLGSFSGLVNNEEEKEQVKALIAEPAKVVKKHPLNEKNFVEFHKYEVKRKVTLRSIDRHVNRLNMLKDFLDKQKFELDYESVRVFLESLDCADKTKTQYLCSFNAFYKFMFNDANFRQKFLINPFMNHAINKVRRGARKEEVRKAFTKDQVKSLYDNAVSQGKSKLADLIQLGAYTGARIEEICQIKLEDLVTVDGVYCFDIKQSKTNAGERLVPIHSKILPMVERLKKDSKDGYLLKTNRGGKYGVKSKEMSSDFSAFKIALGYSKELVFHSFRHTMVTELERADIKNILVMSIVGHEVGGSLSMTFDRYSEGPTPKAKKEAIEKVFFNI
ncbi:tyrosine-type recombinase/integrase [Pseudomonas fulva]|uniref:tyrosine-type recombinase/integrase n=1 Tax=Pseudomonas fulva TaxID=47880 RepID=UPI0015E2EF29|nr:tyrosine-type recombinase/integrase [Pseudomonas fulva]MBA1220002.1 tyrosine-type recombinase/integrase [Pseudomonas fulva]